MKKVILAAFAVALLTLGGTASAIDLVADGGSPATEVVVGSVDVSIVGTDLVVTISITDTDWILVSTKVDARDEVEYIPQNKNHNPKPGQFRYKEPDPVPTNVLHVYTIPLSEVGDDLGPGSDIFVVVHAKVRDIVNLMTTAVCSDGDETFAAVSGPGTVGNPNPAPGPVRGGTAVAAWQHPAWISNVNALFSCGTWIWESYNIQDPVYGTVVDFSETFTIPGVPIGGTLDVTTDNGYEARLNDTLLGTDGLSGDWRNSDLTESFVTTAMSAWSTVESYDLAVLLVEGDNTFNFATVNEYMDTDDGHGSPGTISSNPGALIYEAEITSARQETAWGDGTQFTVVKKSWAMYIEYQIPEPDLIVSDITLDSATITDGDLLAFTYTVENIGGEGPAGNSVFDVAGYLSTDAVLDKSVDTIITGPGGSSGTYSVWTYHLTVGWSQSHHVDDGEITAGPGTYYLIVDADSTNAYPGVYESDEDNNWLAIQFTVVAP